MKQVSIYPSKRLSPTGKRIVVRNPTPVDLYRTERAKLSLCATLGLLVALKCMRK